ncbi:flagellar filament capping protein FliD [Burkholderia sp. 22PA0099]|uniref:flagellar filament capping protein FliD n=1 Tax=Burkholderia sp. 22PA0099 TaxID=3237372 RepID=UPI0039C3D117
MLDLGNPIDTAKSLADITMSHATSRLKNQQARNAATRAALTKLQTALTTFQGAMKGLAGTAGMQKHAAALSDSAAGSVSVAAGARPGSHAFFVEQLASAHQVAFAGMQPVAAAGAGTLGVSLADGTTFDVDLSAAKADASGNLSPAEIARAINTAAGNDGRVSASILTLNGTQQLVLNAGQTGAGGRITLDTSGLGDAGLAASLNAPSELAAARDAIIWYGGKASGTRVQQASNTFTGIEGVSVTFTRAMRDGEAPLGLEIKADADGTAENVQAFVDAYNALMSEISALSKNGGETGEAGPFAGDAGVRALQQRMNALLRGDVDGVRLLDYGISADRNGTLSLDRKQLDAMLAKQPQGLDALFSDDTDGLARRMDDYLKTWTSATDGHIHSRQTSMQEIEKSLSKKAVSLEDQYIRVYNRYLAQFTRVETLQTNMKNTLAILESLPSFSGGKS